MEKIGLVSVTIHAIEASKIKRIPSARRSPMILALSRCSGGSFSAKIAIKTRLSIPKTISNTTSVANPIHAEGSDIHSKIMMHTPASHFEIG